jgi:uncharacterized membrane protein
MIAILFLIIVALHIYHNYTIRKNRLKVQDYRDIAKGPEILKYAAASLIVGLFGLFVMGNSWYYIMLIALFARCAFFDVGFNIATGKSWNYENPKGKSWLDRLELKTKIPFELRFAIYVVCFFLVARFLG